MPCIAEAQTNEYSNFIQICFQIECCDKAIGINLLGALFVCQFSQWATVAGGWGWKEVRGLDVSA